MIWPALLCSLGLPAGALLMRRVPLCAPAVADPPPNVSVIIPARNEEDNLPRLLGSIRSSTTQPAEVIVVDDASTDQTSAVAQSFGARVVAALPLPPGWTGKTWACHQGAQAAAGDVLMFLDADTYFHPSGFAALTARFLQENGAAVSVLPWHVMKRPYEELSLFFNLLMAMGAGAFGRIGHSRLFGQSLVISRQLYGQSGGHSSVRQYILENFMLAPRIASAGGRSVSLGGRGVLNIRMFANGFRQMSEGWTKAFADGAAGSGAAILGVSIVWISALISTLLLLVMGPAPTRIWFLLLYLLYALQLGWMARQVGSYRWLTTLLYPIPLAYYCGIFGTSLYRRVLRRNVTWRGREL